MKNEFSITTLTLQEQLEEIIYARKEKITTRNIKVVGKKANCWRQIYSKCGKSTMYKA